MRLVSRTLTVAVAVVAPFAACAPAPEPVGRLTAEPVRVDLPYPRFADLQLRFEPTAPLEGLVGEANVFVHVLEEPGNVIRTFDHPLPETWTPGEPIEYSIPLYQSALGPPLQPGVYPVSVGIYDGEGSRWPLITDGAEVDSGEYAVAELTVPEAAGEEPMFYFSAAWGPIEGGYRRPDPRAASPAGAGGDPRGTAHPAGRDLAAGDGAFPRGVGGSRGDGARSRPPGVPLAQ